MNRRYSTRQNTDEISVYILWNVSMFLGNERSGRERIDFIKDQLRLRYIDNLTSQCFHRLFQHDPDLDSGGPNSQIVYHFDPESL